MLDVGSTISWAVGGLGWAVGGLGGLGMIWGWSGDGLGVSWGWAGGVQTV